MENREIRIQGAKGLDSTGLSMMERGFNDNQMWFKEWDGDVLVFTSDKAYKNF